jgi:hypothetical protein
VPGTETNSDPVGFRYNRQCVRSSAATLWVRPPPCGLNQGVCNPLVQSGQSIRPSLADICFTLGLWLFPPKVGVGLVPKRGFLLTLAYYTFPRWYEFGERRWNDIVTWKNRRTRRKTCPSAILSTTNPTWIDPGANPGLRGEWPATNDLSHGMTLPVAFSYNKISNVTHLRPGTNIRFKLCE